MSQPTGSLYHLATLLPLLYLTAIAAATPSGEPVFPGQKWQTVAPADVNMDATRLAALADRLKGHGCVVRQGRMAFSWGRFDSPFDVASAVKPVLGHFLWTALAEKRIPSIDEPVARYLPALSNLNERLGFPDRNITWRHLASQTSCYGVTNPPGSAFDYNDYQTALFRDLLFHHAYGLDNRAIDANLLLPRLTQPIHCQDRPTMLHPERPHGRLRISPRDFARLGLLYLHRGRWQNRQILPTNLAAAAVSSPLHASLPRTAGVPADMLPRQPTIGSGGNQEDHAGAYSFLWWVNGTNSSGGRFWPDAPQDAFAALGYGGTRALLVIPSLDTVAVWFTQNTNSPLSEFMSQRGRDLVNGILADIAASCIDTAAAPPRHSHAPAMPAPPQPSARTLSWGPPLTIAADGTMPHACSAPPNALYVVCRRRNRLFLHTTPLTSHRPPTTPEPVPGSEGAVCPWIAQTSNTLWIAWNTRKAVLCAARQADGQWIGPVAMPSGRHKRTLFPQVAALPANPTEALVCSWAVTKAFDGNARLHHLSCDHTKALEARLIGLFGGQAYRPPAIARPLAAGDDALPPLIVLGTSLAHAMPVAPPTLVTDGFDLLPLLPGFPDEGMEAFSLGQRVVLVSSWRNPDGTGSFIASDRSSTNPHMPLRSVSLGPGQGHPRTALQPISGALYALLAREDRAHLVSWPPNESLARDHGSVPGTPLAYGDWGHGPRGCGAGAVVCLPDDRIVVVVSQENGLFVHELQPDPGAP